MHARAAPEQVVSAVPAAMSAPAPRPVSRRRRGLFAAIAALMAMAVTLAALEGVARWLEARPSTAPRRSALPGPKQFVQRHLAQGLEMGKAAGEHRIVVVGDSMSWGWALNPEDAWPARLERRLQGLTRPGVELSVFNTSRPNWNTEQEIDFLRSHLDELSPDAVLVGFCANDTEPTDRAARSELDDLRRRRRPRHRLSRAMHEASALYRLVWERLENRRLREAMAEIYARTYDRQAPSYEAAFDALLAMDRELSERGIPMLIVLIPFFDEPFDGKNTYMRLYQQVELDCAVRGLDCVDLTPLFAGMDPDRLAIDPVQDSHPNEIATRIIADALPRSLVERAMIPVALDGRGAIQVQGCAVDVTTWQPGKRRSGRHGRPSRAGRGGH